MNKIHIIILSIFSTFTVYSQQTIESVITEVEKNNTTLAAYRENVEAEKKGNKIGILPENPEVEFHYLWGEPASIGKRTDFTISQTFDFPTTYIYKTQIADLRNIQSDLEYEKQRKNIVYETRMLCSELIYLNGLNSEYEKRLENDRKISNSYKRKMEVGEASILEHNKAQINLLNTEKQLEQIKIKRDAAIHQLAALNGGKPIAFSDSVFVTELINSDFESWYVQAEQNNPLLSWIKQEIALSDKERKLIIAQNLPKVSAGYMSEMVPDEKFQGLTLGFSIPLWENKNTIKYAKLKANAVQSMETDEKLKFYNEMKITHQKAVALQISVTDFKQRIEANYNIDLLSIALQKGEISLSEYYYELMVFYDSKEELLGMQKELQDCVVKLKLYEE